MKNLVILLLLPLSLSAQQLSLRKYKMGDVSSFRLISERFVNNKFAGKTVAQANLRVVIDSGEMVEEITWQKKSSFSASDTVNQDDLAQKVKPYRISMLPGKKVLLPKLDIPEMVGEITDLNTFLVAVSPSLNFHKLTGKNPRFKNEKVIHGNFGDGVSILAGNDCVEVTQILVERTKHYSVIRTEFQPPAEFCLAPLSDVISKKTFEHPNNFQMLQKNASGKQNLLWGNETFAIVSKIDNHSGKLIEASMENELKLMIRVNVSGDLKSYEHELPYQISRKLKLEQNLK